MFKKTKIYSLVFKILISIILLNINGLVYLLTGFTGLISPLILLFSIYLIIYAKHRSISKLLRFYFGYLIIYLVLGLIALLLYLQVGRETDNTILDLLKTMLIIYALFLGYREELKRNGYKIIRFTFWVIIISVVLSCGLDYLKIAAIQARYRTDTRMSGFFANPNELASQALFSILAIQYLFKSYTKKIYKIFLGILLLICFYTMFMAFSRAIFISFFILLFLQLTVYKGLTFKAVFIAFIGVVILGIALPKIYEDSNRSLQRRMDRTLTIFDGGVSDENSGGRLELYGHAMDYINEYPLTGIGMGNMQRIEGVGGVHNAYLAVWGNAGILALLLFILFLSKFIFELHKYVISTKNTFFLFVVLTIMINGITKLGVYEFKINNLIFAMSFAVLFFHEYTKKMKLTI
ncbi:O-antigen ligase family protein [Aureivirga sp. CE67]|uniref:O-antigen ligase family protein n=1 Tax=Aureivirga sp. CE67 TaxID=1788983 RepID=UPI0018CA427F|nr:O-antigen ligase family protein [Aureivirga sp. CE67]